MLNGLNGSQKKALSSFFVSIAVAWFSAIFAVPVFEPQVNLLTLSRFGINMLGAIYIALFLLKGEK